MGLQRPFAQSVISGTVRTGGVLHNVFFDVLRLGPYALPLIPGALSQVEQGVQATEAFDGVVGSNLLFRFQATYDFAGGSLYLAPNPYLYVPFYDFLQPAADPLAARSAPSFVLQGVENPVNTLWVSRK